MIFWTKFAQKRCFPSGTEKVNTTMEFCIFELVYVPNFSLNWQFWFFRPNLPKKCVCEPNFSFQWQFWFSFDQICPKTVFPVENGKIALVCASMVVTYYVKLFRTGPDRHNGILMSLLLLIVEAIKNSLNAHQRFFMTKNSFVVEVTFIKYLPASATHCSSCFRFRYNKTWNKV